MAAIPKRRIRTRTAPTPKPKYDGRRVTKRHSTPATKIYDEDYRKQGQTFKEADKQLDRRAAKLKAAKAASDAAYKKQTAKLAKQVAKAKARQKKYALSAKDYKGLPRNPLQAPLK